MTKSSRYLKLQSNDENYQLLKKLFGSPKLDSKMNEGFFLLGSSIYVITLQHEQQIRTEAVGVYYPIDIYDFKLSLKIAIELEYPNNSKYKVGDRIPQREKELYDLSPTPPLKLSNGDVI